MKKVFFVYFFNILKILGYFGKYGNPKECTPHGLETTAIITCFCIDFNYLFGGLTRFINIGIDNEFNDI